MVLKPPRMKYESLSSDKFYHIYNRGNNKENVFIEEQNYAYFLLLIRRHLLPVSDIYAYCLLKNHFHILVKTKEFENDALIGNGFSNLFNAYAKAINKKYNRTGSLFKDRYSRVNINDEEYLRALILYIHLNPEHHGFTSDFSSYSHSSYKALISNKETELKRVEVLELFDDQDNFIFCHLERRNMIERLGYSDKLE